jgi:drug/metabolite transporter (DMT)-like permease
MGRLAHPGHAHPKRGIAPQIPGTLLALLSALLFGASMPAVQGLGRGLGPFATAAILYAGAAAFAGLSAGLGRPRAEAPLRLRHLPRLAAVAIAGALLAPVALVWGLARSSGVAASLLINLEAVFTLILGALVHREHVGRRIAVAALAMTAGGTLVVVGSSGGGRAELWGLAAVTLATLGWAADNTLARPLSDLDPASVVAAKGALGAVLSLGLALLSGEALPGSAPRVAGLLAVGALGYGLSLRLYLLAQRRLGAGRTASVYAVAPFAGALVAGLAGQPLGGPASAAGGALLALGVVLHLTERHEHDHHHEAVEHEHAHRHDDGHHDHTHDIMPDGEHSHPHRHEPVRHEHPHAPDLHHRHDHA